MNKRILKNKTNEKYQLQAFIWLMPTFVLLFIFSYYPPIRSIVMSFTDANGTGSGNFVFLDNYIELFKSNVFWISMRNIVIFTVFGLIAGNSMTIILAELLYNLKSKRLSAFFRFLFIVPILVPGVVIVLIWQYIVFAGGDMGFANLIIGIFGIKNQNWYFDPVLSPVSILLTNFPWVAGTSFLIYLAGLQSISPSVIEASKLDGANVMQRVFKIDLPLLSGQIKYFVIMGIIGGLQNFDLQLLVTGSGPGTTNSVNVPGYMLYENAFTYDRYGYASAIGIVIFIITLTITIFNMKKIKGTGGNF